MKDKLNAILLEINPKGNIGYKDNFLTRGYETTAGSNVLKGYISHYSATVVDLFEKNGFVTKAKFNCDAWAHGSSGENSDFGAVKNPWNNAYTPGGSSSGSSAAVASNYTKYATGTDTGGSIRLPAAFTNSSAIKPTYGAISRYGIVAMASSTDCPSLIAQNVKDVEVLFKIVSREDKKDANTFSSKRSLRGGQFKPGSLKIGLPKEYFIEGLDREVSEAVRQARQVLTEDGYKIENVSLPHTKYGIAVYYLIMPVEVASNLARYDGVRYGQARSFFGEEAERRIILGTFTSSAGYSAKYYQKAAKVRTLIIQDFDQVFKKVDVLLTPVSPTPPFKLGEKVNDPLKMYLSDVLTVNTSLAGLPSLALSCGFTKKNLPIGMQFVGPRWSEPVLFSVGKRYQELTDWHKRKPSI